MQANNFKEMEEVFSAAANKAALKIFYAARDGIKSSTQTIKELDLTQKKYYTHLKKLIDAGLIEKTEGAYRHTSLGKICFKLTEVFKNALSHRDRLDLVDRLRKAESLTLEETEEIMRAILKDTNIVPGERITDLLGPVRMADTWEKVVEDVTEYVESAKESIYFASQYTDMRAIEALFRAAQRGVKLNLLTGQEDQVSNALNILLRSIFMHPKHLKFLFQLLSSPELRIRSANLPYTFVVVDRKIAVVEVVKPFTKAFSLAFIFHNERLVNRLIESFEVLYEKGTDVRTIINKFIKRKT
ncbi:MAG: ArsR family transcriptional regulator [Candidatus Bathyarchaeota archaeon]|nr:ArsR family transcriptional regulator [Candidatus Bathyarchaeota archaeon]